MFGELRSDPFAGPFGIHDINLVFQWHNHKQTPVVAVGGEEL
jgi:hypothetical protein